MGLDNFIIYMSLSIFLPFNHQSSLFIYSAELKGTVFQSEDEVDEKVATRLKTDLRIPDLCKVNASNCCRKRVMAWTTKNAPQQILQLLLC